MSSLSGGMYSLNVASHAAQSSPNAACVAVLRPATGVLLARSPSTQYVPNPSKSPGATGEPIAIVNCVFNGNSGTEAGGGAVYILMGSPVLDACTFTANHARDGGAVHSDFREPLTIENCTFTANLAPQGRALGCDETSSLHVANCILWDGGDEVRTGNGSTVIITYSNVEGDWPGEGNLDTDPLFVDADNGDYRLKPDSPALKLGFQPIDISRIGVRRILKNGKVIFHKAHYGKRN